MCCGWISDALTISFERLFSSGRRSPTMLLLDDWGTTGRNRPTVKLLLDNLIKAEQYRAADYVAVNVLKGEDLLIKLSLCLETSVIV